MQGTELSAISKNKLEGLEVVRALAALVVLIGHGIQHEILMAPTAAKMVFNFATEAVIIFFVLSGTVISLNHENDVGTGKNSALIYGAKRLIRIYPIYIVAFFAAVAAEAILNDRLVATGQIIGNLAFLQSLQGFIVGLPPANTALWTLANEMTYYALFMVVIFQPSFRRAYWILAIGAAVMSGHGYLSGYRNDLRPVFDYG